ncbi:hypothetical protein NG800_018245 [Epilithonimonas ginsengisoli]|uniref:Uncharacterized protein n=1 Tax=Epilithonimonas ginsengisoli TaxID=1245592 RepID=A0ABU4JME2_9FLAO|nr:MULTISPECIES: hypothetical protein [Chryseobacterium group]MBV6881831.1 hypothetical protein [Epilithonimonas sp. FP105]MDW8550874.1 hypothetical protein [Epilithonimonas ginsengisoli]OAH74123.1 hypothetical protein AXA65_06855 [Chryseobacterium sp. FP211-J200]
MSRTRFVKGTYTKVSQNGHSMYSNESIISNAVKWVSEVGEKLGISYGAPANPPPTEIKAKCVVHFRSKDGWKGEDYGFDWMRIGETSVFGDTNYEDIVAKQYTDSTHTTPVTDINAYNGSFQKSPTLYSNLGRVYGVYNIPWKKKADGTVEKYYCSWVSLYPSQIKNSRTQKRESSNFKNTKALLSLNIEVDEEPDTLKFKTNKFFRISPIDITAKSKGKHTLKDFVTIECLEEFATDQVIEVIATKKNAAGAEVSEVAGRLKVWANHNPRRKKTKFLIIELKTNISGIPGSEIKGNSTGQKELFENYLRQALIEATVETEIVDMSGDIHFQPNGRYVAGGQIAAYYSSGSHTPAGFISLQEYVYSELKKILKSKKITETKYDNHYIAVYLPEPGGSVDASGNINGLNGYSSGKFVVLFPTKNDQTAAHEFLHSFELPHSFTNSEADNKAEYTYEYAKTENIMDYSHHIPQNRFNLWKWQWMIANNNVK